MWSINRQKSFLGTFQVLRDSFETPEKQAAQ